MIERATSGYVQKPSYEVLSDKQFSQVSHRTRHYILDALHHFPTINPQHAELPQFQQIDERLKEHIAHAQPLIADFRKELPQIDSTITPEDVERLTRLAFGLYNRPDIIFADRLNKEQKIYAASLTHDVVLAVLSVQSQHSTDWYQSMVFTILNQQGLITDQLGNANLKKFWAGVKYEVGLIRALTKMGLDVFVPDPTQPNSVSALDIENGIDLIAVDPATNGTILTINAKGGMRPEGIHTYYDFVSQGVVNRETNPTVTQALTTIAARTQDVHRNISGDLNKRDIIAINIAVPIDSPAYWLSVNFKESGKSAEGRRAYIAMWAKLKPVYEDAIGQSVTQLITDIDLRSRGRETYYSK